MKYCQSDILSCIRRFAFKCVDFLINHPLPLLYLGVFLEKPQIKIEIHNPNSDFLTSLSNKYANLFQDDTIPPPAPS